MRSFFLLAILLMNSVHGGEIIVTNDFNRIVKEAKKLDSDSLILFDVDGTLIVPKDAILLPQAKDLFKQLVASYTDRDLFRDIRMKAIHNYVHEGSADYVRKLQQRKISII